MGGGKRRTKEKKEVVDATLLELSAVDKSRCLRDKEDE